MTGWGQDGPLALAVGHDLNYPGAERRAVARRPHGAPPVPPPTVLGDGGGALGLAFGVMSAVFYPFSRTGKGCVIDCSIIDVAASLSGIALAVRVSGCARSPPSPSPFHDSPFDDI